MVDAKERGGIAEMYEEEGELMENLRATATGACCVCRGIPTAMDFCLMPIPARHRPYFLPSLI